jgi:hypothetical protein
LMSSAFCWAACFSYGSYRALNHGLDWIVFTLFTGAICCLLSGILANAYFSVY